MTAKVATGKASDELAGRALSILVVCAALFVLVVVFVSHNEIKAELLHEASPRSLRRAHASAE
jgi:hypothetical protein